MQNVDTAGAFAHIPVTTEVLEPPTKKPRLNKELNDLPERESVKQMETAKAKIECMKELHDKASTWGKLTPGAKSFVTKHLTPAMNSLKYHFGDDTESFSVHFPDFNHTTFPKKHCGGKGGSCTPKT